MHLPSLSGQYSDFMHHFSSGVHACMYYDVQLMPYLCKDATEARYDSVGTIREIEFTARSMYCFLCHRHNNAALQPQLVIIDK